MASNALLRVLLLCIEELRKLDPQMQMQTAEIFIHVALNDGDVSVSRLAELAGVSQSTASRSVQLLGSTTRHKTRGHGVLTSLEDPTERRRKIVRLTPKGQRVARTLEEMLK